MSNTFVVSDWHFSHKGATVWTFEDGTKQRPFDTIEEMDEALVERHNAVVRPKDKVYVLGDCAINRKGLHHVGRLNGDKVLIKGNHDIFPLDDYTKYFRDIRAYHIMDKILLAHIPVHPANLSRWRGQIHGHLHTDNVTETQSIAFPNFSEPFGEVVFEYVTNPDPRYFNVSVEQINYTPVPFEQVNDIFKERGL